MSDHQKKAKIPLAEQHRAAHAARNIIEKYYDREIDKAAEHLNEERVKELSGRKSAHIAAMEALLKTLDPMVEFEADTRTFLIGLVQKQKLAA
jgi:hypothetical protein